MSQQNPLNIIINPPGEERLEPGATSQIRVVVTDRANYPMVIEVQLDLPDLIRSWCKFTRTSFNLDSGRSQEVSFEWKIPHDAIPGTYNYDLVVDSPHSLPAPLRYLRKLEVLTPIARQVSTKDPTFILKPATSSTKPIVWQWGQTVSVIVLVHNRSNIVDEFRLSCDLNDNWYRVRYPEGIEESGLINGGNKLSLNPNSKGQIVLLLEPPVDSLAGNYQPTINLHSTVKPDLFLQDIFYLRVPPVYNLQVELQTIRNKVKQKSALFNVQFKNDGNTIRQVNIQAHTADEDEFGEYQLERSQVRIPPGKTVDVGLKVTVKSKSQRSFFRAKQLSFVVEIEDVENNPLPKYLPLKANLLWQARPLWQLIALILLVLALLTGAFFLVRWILTQSNPVPQISIVNTEDKSYSYGERITLNWEIENADKLNAIAFYTDKDSPGTEIRRDYKKSELIEPSSEQLFRRYDCSLNSEENKIECSKVTTGASEVGKYTFIVEVYAENSDRPTDTKKIQATISPPNRPAILDLKVAKEKYEPNEKIELQFEIDNPETVEAIEIVSSNRFRILSGEYRQARDEQEISIEFLKNKFCRIEGDDKNRLDCKVPVSFISEGNYRFTIRLISNYNAYNQPQQISAQLDRSFSVEKPSVPLEIVKFTINRKSIGPVSIEIDERLYLSWRIKGEGVKVSITDSGKTYQANGTAILGPYRAGTTKTIVLRATDSEGAIDQRNIDIEVESLPEQRIILPPEN
ncbi:MAG: hypothetical protein QNJ38_13685 [Prochloraceae cyanobacterium]|nr:hypothetical protein [Prochloraceae cyanobacterium]